MVKPAPASLGADACSSSSQRLGEPLAGSAPHARSWIVIEQPGPWGRDALHESRMSPAIADWLDHLSAAIDARVILARRADRRRIEGLPRNVWLAVSDPLLTDAPRMRRALVDNLHQITEWDLGAMALGKLPEVGEEVTGPIEFVCTHSGRDACCALLGRARALHTPNSWECSHLGGHRFAATSVLLPLGGVFGRLSPTDALDVEHLRGLSYLSPALQVADIAVRHIADLSVSARLTTQPDANRDPGSGDTIWAQVFDTHGSRWSVRCESSAIERPASCNAEASMATIWRAVEVAPH